MRFAIEKNKLHEGRNRPVWNLASGESVIGQELISKDFPPQHGIVPQVLLGTHCSPLAR